MVAADNSSTSPFANNVYCSWSILQSNNGPYFVNFNRSTNSGASFTAPITLKPNNGMGQGTNVQTGPNGEVYVCWADYDVDGTSKVIYPSHGLGFCSSANGGVSFTPYQRVLNYTGIRASSGVDPLFNNVGMNDFPSMAVDKSNGPHRGRIYVVIPIKENGNGKSVVGFTFSNNKGVTWTTPTTISISTGRQNFFPWITVDDCTGDVWATYYSFDTPSGFTTNTYVTHSADGGVTWESQKVSDVSHITAPINNAIFRTGYAGDYIGITAFGGKAFPIWMDNRNGTWQLYCSPVTSNISAFNISGDASFCTTSNPYTIPNLPAGATVTWSASPYGSVQINSPNSNSTTLTNLSSGVVILTAAVNNVCGTNQIVVNKQITVGNPLTGTINQSGNLTSMNTVNNISSGATLVSFQWPGVSGISCYQSSTNPPISQTGFIYYAYNNSFWFTLTSGQSITVSLSGTGCAGTTMATRTFTVSGHYYIISPNPANSSINITPALPGNNLKTENSQIGTTAQVSIMDVNGILKKQQQFSGNTSNMQLNVADLIPGTYFVRIINGNINETHQLIINR
ncbi:MAG: T9SS type A sorting domain-containing protein [Ginsengibacter sp.]